MKPTALALLLLLGGCCGPRYQAPPPWWFSRGDPAAPPCSGPSQRAAELGEGGSSAGSSAESSSTRSVTEPDPGGPDERVSAVRAEVDKRNSARMPFLLRLCKSVSEDYVCKRVDGVVQSFVDSYDGKCPNTFSKVSRLLDFSFFFFSFRDGFIARCVLLSLRFVPSFFARSLCLSMSFS